LEGCNIDYSKQAMVAKMDNYYQINSQDLEDMTDWFIENIKVDSSYKIWQNRGLKVFFQYLDADSLNGGLFYPKKIMPEKFEYLMASAMIRDVYKWKSKDFFLLNLGTVYRHDYIITVLILKNGIVLDKLQFPDFKPYAKDLFLKDDKSNFIDKRTDRFYFLINKKEDAD
jgi:hypothetical protein